ncbi:MAG: hypothetical protein J6A29_03315 [Clostridia bacterium]|nr:hypothetical protein [Clostridia bacterium]
MATCLGLFVQNNLIKYAKVSRENENIKIENYGVKFYEQDLPQTIEKIVDETFSYKTPISINISNEKYTNAEIFGLLNDADQKKSIKTEFDYFYNQAGKNRLTVEYRTVISNSSKDSDKKNVLYVYTEKGNIAEKMQTLDNYRLTSLCPISLAIPQLQEEGNCIIVNIEDRTEVTTVINNTPTNVDIIDTGMEEILKNIATKENSISKAYEICKNTTLYTESSQNLQTENNEYLEIIVPTIYKIIEQVKEIIAKNDVEVNKIYLTGTGIIINNIDLYFQENFLNYKCEILTPYFVDKTSLKINIKDYLEVNSAIALAMQGTNKKNRNISFVNKSEKWDKILDLLNSDVKSINKKQKGSKDAKIKSSINFNIKEINCIRFAYGTLCLLIIYVAITAVLHGKINDKTLKIQEVIDDTIAKTDSLSKQTTLINSRANSYQEILNQLKEADEQAAAAYGSKNAIPNLLSQIMFAIPKEVQILSIQNTSEKHIKIEAQSREYQYLGYLKAEIQNRAILINVTSTSGTRDSNGMIKVTIEGDLSY